MSNGTSKSGPSTDAGRGAGIRMTGRRVSLAFIGLFLGAHAVWSIGMNLGFRARLPALDTLTANLLALALLVVGLLFVAGKLTPTDVGLRSQDLRGGLLFTAVFFVLLQLVLLGYARVVGLDVMNEWTRLGVGTAAYLLLGQLVGNALYEEVAFRGFLMPQLFRHLGRAGKVIGLPTAVVLSQALFALAHVPNRLWVTGLAAVDLPGALLPLFILGVYFAVLYLMTENLFAVVGVHALINEPFWLPVGVGGGNLDGTHVIAGLVVGLVLAVLWRVRRRGAYPSH